MQHINWVFNRLSQQISHYKIHYDEERGNKREHVKDKNAQDNKFNDFVQILPIGRMLINEECIKEKEGGLVWRQVNNRVIVRKDGGSYLSH